MATAASALRRPVAIGALFAVVLVIAFPMVGAQPAFATTTFVVNTTADDPDINDNDDVCDSSPEEGSQCTLRAAIQQANHTLGFDTIAFDIPGPGLKTIQPRNQLPPVFRPAIIDGYTQSDAAPNTAAIGTNAVLRIELDGSLTEPTGLVDGLEVRAPRTIVRGLIINRFPGGGIYGAPGSFEGFEIAGCFLGVNAEGTEARPNVRNGIRLYYSNATIGGATLAARNLISGNAGSGIVTRGVSSKTQIQGNIIGPPKSGYGNLGNGAAGIELYGNGVQIGGPGPAANIIAYNRGDGVAVVAGTRHRIGRNSIVRNLGEGIDLGGDGRTPNDLGDSDGGANALQNYPVLTGAAPSAVRGRLLSTPNRSFTLLFFSNVGGGDEGQVFRGPPLTVTTDTDGRAFFVFTPDSAIPPGHSVTATATSSNGDTSEFSDDVTVQ